MRSIIINEAQDEMLRVSNLPILETLTNSVSADEAYVPFKDTAFAEKLIKDGYKTSVSDFKDDITQIPNEKVINELSKLSTILIRKEIPIKSELEKLCYNTVVDLFNIPQETVDFELEIVEQIDPSHEFHITPNTDEERQYDSVEQIDNESSEVEKRKILNILICGIADKITESCRKDYLSELFELDEELPYLYSKFVKVNRYALYTNNVNIEDNNHYQGGYVEVRLGNTDSVSKITVKAVTFPILLFETIRGLLELVISNGLPDSFDEASVVVDKADILSQDPWNMRMGLPLWNRITDDKEINSRSIPSILDEIATIPTPEFIALFNEIVHSTKKGYEEIGSIISKGERETDYNDFLDDMMGKQEDKMLIDEKGKYLTEDELINY
jgi:hypothetical protein